MEKPTDCPICYESLQNEPAPLRCGHWLHLSCVRRHFKPECPICRRGLDITVTGKQPQPFVPIDEPRMISPDEIIRRAVMFVPYSVLLPTVIERDDDIVIEEYEPTYRQKGYLYPEEDDDYDEENPHGDNYDYEDI